MSSQLPHRALLPVIHVHDFAQMLRNVRVAFENGAHGVFLINHGSSSIQLLKWYHELRVIYPNVWIGINCLDLDVEQALTIVPHSVSGLWVDSIDIRSDQPDPAFHARRYRQIQQSLVQKWKGLLFGGVAFKYQPSFGDPAEEASIAAPFVDVITTSGDGTGIAPDAEKIRRMKAAVPNKPLAIASGVTPENIQDFPDANYIMAATGISDSFTELNPTRVRALADQIR